MADNANDTNEEFDFDDLAGEPSSSRWLTSAKLGRIAAVGFFLLLGSFAVLHSMNRASDDQQPNESSSDRVAANDPKADDSLASDTEITKTSTLPANKSAPQSNPVGNFLGQKPADKSTVKTTAPAIAAAAQTNPARPSNRITDRLKKTPVVPQSLTAKTEPAPPVARLAQVPGKPLIPSRSGFGKLQKKPADNGFTGALNKLTASAKQPGAKSSNGFALPAAKRPALPNSFNPTNKTSDQAKKLFDGFADGTRKIQTAADNRLKTATNSIKGLTQDASNTLAKTGSKLRETVGPPAARGFGSDNKNKPDQRSNSFAASPRQSNIVTATTSVRSNAFGNPQKSTTNRTPLGQSNRFTSRSAAPPTKPQKVSGLRSSTTGTQSITTQRTAPAQTNEPAGRTPATTRPRQRDNRPFQTASTGRRATGGVRSLVGATPARRVAAAVTSDIPGDRRLDGMQAPALTIQKLSPEEIQVNQPADFQIVIRNVGPVAVDDVRVFDEIPVGTEFIEANPRPTETNNRRLNWAVGTVNPGTEKRINLRLKPTKPGEIGSVAQMTFSTRSSMRTRVTQPLLEITHRTQPQVLVGDDVVFDVVVTNRGDGPAKEVFIQEDIPEQLDFRDGFREIEYEVGTLLPNQSRNIRLTLRAGKSGQFDNIIFASGLGGLKSQHKLNMEVVAPKLVAKSDGPIKRYVGRQAKHQFSVTNNGTAVATNVDLIARLPAGLRYVNSNNKGTYDPNNHSVFWELAELQRDLQADVELVTEPVSIGSQPIKFEARADLNLSDSVQQPLSVEHLVDVFFDIDDVVDPIEIGSETRYRVEVVNQGTKPATNVRLQIDFPAGLQPTAVDGPLSNQINGQQIVFSPISSLRPGERIQFQVSGLGQAAGDHRVALKMQTDGRTTAVAKEESTRVYSDR